MAINDPAGQERRMESLQGGLGGNLVSTVREHPEVHCHTHQDRPTGLRTTKLPGPRAPCAQRWVVQHKHIRIGQPLAPDRSTLGLECARWNWAIGKTVWPGRCREPDTGGESGSCRAPSLTRFQPALPRPVRSGLVRPQRAPFPNGAHVPGGAFLLSRAAEPFAESRTWISAMPPARVRRRCQAARSI